jgi:hypothetical protein
MIDNTTILNELETKLTESVNYSKPIVEEPTTFRRFYEASTEHTPRNGRDELLDYIGLEQTYNADGERRECRITTDQLARIGALATIVAADERKADKLANIITVYKLDSTIKAATRYVMGAIRHIRDRDNTRTYEDALQRLERTYSPRNYDDVLGYRTSQATA